MERADGWDRCQPGQKRSRRCTGPGPHVGLLGFIAHRAGRAGERGRSAAGGIMRDDVIVRPAVDAEREQLEALQRRASLNNPGDRQALLAHPDAIELPLEQIRAGGVYVAEVAGSILGFAAILPREDGDSELDALFVEPDVWRRGIGRELVERCAAAARAAGAESLHVVGNPHAEGFYFYCIPRLIARKCLGYNLLSAAGRC